MGVLCNTALYTLCDSHGIAMATGSGTVVLLPATNTSAWTAVTVSNPSLAVKVLDTCDVNADGRPGTGPSLPAKNLVTKKASLGPWMVTHCSRHCFVVQIL